MVLPSTALAAAHPETGDPLAPRHWVHPSARRYYRARLFQNLFGHWEIEQVWGSQNSRHGGCRVVPVSGGWAGTAAMISKRRSSHGYELRAANIFQTN